MECELLLLQPRLLPAWLARFEPSKENAAFRANREARTSHPRLAVCAKCCAWLITDLQCSSLRGRRLKGNGKGVLGAGETPEAREEGGRETPARRPLACVASVSVRFGSKERGTRVKHRAKNGLSKRAGRGFHFLALVSFLARPKLRIPFLGLSLLRNGNACYWKFFIPFPDVKSQLQSSKCHCSGQRNPCSHLNPVPIFNFFKCFFSPRSKSFRGV